MMKNAYLLAKIGADPAENEQRVAEMLTKFRAAARGVSLPEGPPSTRRRPSRPRGICNKFADASKICQLTY